MMTIAELPDGYTVRPPESSDAEALFEMLAAYNSAVVGFADTTLEEVAYCIGQPGFDPVNDGWLGAFDEATRWAAHAVITECFTGQFGWVETPRDQWVEALDDVPIFDWSQLTLLEVDGRMVGVCYCNDKFVESDSCGHIGMLGVVEEFRGRGLAKYLLRHAFAVDAAAGREGTILHVDTNNPTPALDLYLSVGMNPTVIFDGWRRVLPAA